MVEDALSFWTEIQRYEDMLVADAKSHCFAPLSELYRKLGLVDDAISVAQKGCALHPDYPAGFLALGTACCDKGLTAEARQALERVVSLKPDHLQALKLLGQLYVEQGEVLLARKVLGQVLEQDPDDLESTLLLNSVSAVTPRTRPEEELLEEVEIIEELEEVLDEADILETVEPLDLAELAAQPAPPRGAAVPLEESDDFWAIEDLEGMEQPQQTPAPPFTAAPKTGVATSQKDAAPDPLTTATLAELYATQGFTGKALNIYRELLQAHPSNQQYRLRCAELLELQELQHQVQQPAEPVSALETPQAVQVQDDIEAQDVIELPEAMEESFAMEALDALGPAALESAAAFESAALEAVAKEAPAAPAATPALQGDVEAELQHWLENIRRRKDGV